MLYLATITEEDRQKIEGYLAWKWGLETALPADHPYKNAAPIGSNLLRSILQQNYMLLQNLQLAIFDQDYGLCNRYVTELIQIYGIRILSDFIQLYGNSFQYRTLLRQPYSDAALIRRLVIQIYGDAARYRGILDQEWRLPEALRQINIQRYGISDTQYRALCDYVYDISERDLVRSLVDQLYVLAAGEALVQRMDQEVRCDGVVHASAYNIFLEQDESLFHMVGELQLADESEFLQYHAYESEVSIVVDGREYLFLADGYPRKSRQPGENSFVVPLISKTILLDAPHSSVAAGGLSGMASALVVSLAAPFVVNWQLVDWFIPAGVLQANGDSAIAIVKKIVSAAGGLVQTAPDGTLICRPEYPVSVNQWATTEPDIELTDQDDFFQIDPSPSTRAGYNVFYLSNQSLTADSVALEVVTLSSTLVELRVRLLPWSYTAQVKMRHSGGLWVSVINFGPMTADMDEQVEIISGSGQTSKPVAALIGYAYHQADLGMVTVSESGVVTTEIDDNSLLQLQYRTRYWMFRATDQQIEDVQFFPEVIDG